MNLRDYQSRSIEMLKSEITMGVKRILAWLMTGAGKGLIMSQLTSNALKKGKKVLTVMRRRELVFQTAQNYYRYHNIESSIIMSASKKMDTKNPCQIASIDTIYSRMGDLGFLKQFDLVIVDEGHDCNSRKYCEFFEFMGDKIFIGFTATPFSTGKKPLGFWRSVIKPIEAHELRDQGFLCSVKTFAPSVIDTSKITKRNGEFDQAQLFEKVSENKIIGDIVGNYIKYGQKKPAILFAVNKKHSAMMSYAFNERGISSIHIDESHNSKERQSAIKDFTEGRISVLCNVNIFSTGIDLPLATIGIMARPTMSQVLWCQQIGRLLRPYPGKEYAIILDHAGNTFRHGGSFDIREHELGEKKEKEENIRFKTCHECFAVLNIGAGTCPECGAAPKTNTKEIKHEAGELVEIEDGPITKRYREIKIMQKQKGYKDGWSYHKIYGEFGHDIFKEVPMSWFWRKEVMGNG